MSSIRKRTNGIYECRFYYNKKYYSVYSENLKELSKKKIQKLKEIKETINNNIIYNFDNLNQWSIYWLENFKKPFVKEKTYNEILSYLKNHIIKHLGNIKLKNINSQILQEFFNQYSKSRTKEIIFLYLNAVLQKAQDIGLIKINPLKAVVKDKKIKTNKLSFTFNEQKLILEKLKEPLKNIILIYLLTGLRKNEINQIIEINENYIKVVKEKSDNEIKTISLTTKTIELIKETINKKINTDYISKQFTMFLKENNILNKSLHTTRHTYATNNYYLETPIKHLQEFMGHKDIQTTLNIYTNLDNSIKKEELIKLYNNNYYIVKI